MPDHRHKQGLSIGQTRPYGHPNYALHQMPLAPNFKSILEFQVNLNYK